MRIKDANIKNLRVHARVPGDGLTSATAGISAWQIKQDYPSSTDGLYWIQIAGINGGTPFQIYADMTTDGGGWTLLMQNTVPTWDLSNALFRNETSAPSSLEVAYSGNDAANYSIIGWADYIKRSASGFEYMLEAGDRNSNGGIFTANEAYSFLGEVDLAALASEGAGVYFGGVSQDVVAGSTGFRQNVTLTTKFGTWDYNDSGLEHRMPWYTANDYGIAGQAIFTTTHNDPGSWWGTLMDIGASFQPAPWQSDTGVGNPGIIWYWVR